MKKISLGEDFLKSKIINKNRNLYNYPPKRSRTLSLCWIEGYRELKLKRFNRIHNVEKLHFFLGGK